MDLTAIPSPAPCLSVVKTCDDHKLMHDLGNTFHVNLYVRLGILGRHN